MIIRIFRRWLEVIGKWFREERKAVRGQLARYREKSIAKMEETRAKGKKWGRIVHIRFMYLAAGFFALCAACLSYSGLLDNIDLQLSDIVYQMFISDSGDEAIKIISIDEKTIEEYGEYKDWSRSITADLIRKLNGGENAPYVIGIDLDYSQDGDRKGDQALVDICRQYSNICIGASAVIKRDSQAHEQQGSLSRKNPDPAVKISVPDGILSDHGQDMFADKVIDKVNMPFRALAENVTTGIVNNIMNSGDGFVRNAVTEVIVDGEQIDSFSVAVYKIYMDSQGREYALPRTGEDNAFGFIYSREGEEYTVYSFSDVLNGRISPKAFQDSIVLIGDYMDNAAFKVPNQRGTAMREVELQANILEALLLSKTGQSVSKFFMVIGCAVFVWLFYIATSYSSGSRTVIMALSLLVLLVLLCFWLAHYGYYIHVLIPAIFIVIVSAFNLLVRYHVTARNYRITVENKDAIEDVFRKYVDESVVNEIIKNDGSIEAHIGVVRKDIAVLFMDIRGFTTLSENMKPEEIVEILNGYLSVAALAVAGNKGTLDKFIGDAAMAVFNSPEDLEDYEYRAVNAALNLLSSAEVLGRECMDTYGKKVSIGIGIHCGEAVIGNIGSETHMDYTAIGDTVNTASRLEGIAPPGEIIISEEMNRRLEGRIRTSFSGVVELKGKKNKVQVYKVEGLIPDGKTEYPAVESSGV